MGKFVMAGVLALGLCAPLPAQENRTYLDTIDLSSPEMAAETFVGLYRDSDYFGVYFTLSSDARQGFVRLTALFNIKAMFPAMDSAMLPGAVQFDADLPHNTVYYDLMSDAVISFDNVLLAAERAGMLAFTFGPQAAVADVMADGEAAQVRVATDGEPAEVTLDLALNDLGQWRIDRVRWAGSDAEAQPWGGSED